jgi:hypothetical protein
LKVWSNPTSVPIAFVATARKWYVVDAARPPTSIPVETGEAPPPMGFAGVEVP